MIKGILQNGQQKFGILNTEGSAGTLEMTFSAYSLLEDEIQVLDADEKEKMLSQVKQAIGCLADESCDFAVLGEKMNQKRRKLWMMQT